MASSSRARPSSTPPAATRARPLELERDRGQVVVAAGAGRLDGRGGMAGGQLRRPLVQAQLGLGEVQPAALDAARVPLDVPEAAAQPAHRDRRLALVEVLVEQPGGGPGRAPVVPGPPVGAWARRRAAIESPVRHSHQAASASASSAPASSPAGSRAASSS